ncbi:GNAT family N-acyltransferase, partial [Streptomyces sp. WAC06614]|uniref:GNAT family N-acyltransferase n=1 Tax=Streptomyces sp. WAC06614 TaxID=2487416 RepID=UPI0021B01924
MTIAPVSPLQPATDLPAPHYTVRLARDEDEVRAAQRLRHLVFAGEMGARLDGPEPGVDSDAFDAYCDHLLVVEERTEQVVGTYRLLPPERAAVAGRLYSEGEFDLSALAPIRPDLVEVGRSCVHPAHRNGAVIALIWAGLARYMDRSGHNWLAGCCSIPLADGGVLAAATRETVLGALQQLVSRPDRAAQPTASRRTDLIGMIVSDYRDEREVHYLRAFLGMRVSGLILVSQGMSERAASEIEAWD